MLHRNSMTSSDHPDYERGALGEADAGPDPLALFGRWYDEAKAAVRDRSAMTLATADGSGQPSARTVLLKGFDSRGFVFFTNFDSRKGRALDVNPRAALLFFWPELERQVRIEGSVERVDAEESDRYFASRPLGSRYGAWASPQSRVLPDRAALEALVADAEARFPAPGGPPRPGWWGGYRVAPASVEFWQGRASRLHDRLLYLRDGGGWKRLRLAP